MQEMDIASDPPIESRILVPIVSFYHRDANGIIQHEDDPLVIDLQIHDLSLKRVLIDLDISTYILYW